MSMTDFQIVGVRVLSQPLDLPRGARVMAEFDIASRGFLFEGCRLYHVEGKGWGWWTPNPRVKFPREMRGPIKEAVRKTFDALTLAR